MVIYVNWEQQNVLTQKGFDLYKENRMQDDDYLSEYLDDRYSSAELLKMSDEQRKGVENAFRMVLEGEIEEEWEKIFLQE